MVRTRSAAASLVEAGHVRVNGARVLSASHALRANDVITLALDNSVRIVRVTAFTGRRGDATAARALYELIPRT